MAAAALEQSMLESKDKDTLLEMSKALGVKASSRLKKADIIAKILDTTGPAASASGSSPTSSSADSDSAKPGNSADKDQSSADSPKESTAKESTGSNSARTSPKSAEASPVTVGPDGEPLADWEIELASKEGEANQGDSKQSDTKQGDDSKRGDARRGNSNQNDSQSDGDKSDESQSRSTSNEGGNSQPRNRNTGRNRNRNDGQGGGRGNDRNNQSGGNRNDGQGADGSRRRRRRRKGRGGQEGPQGEDLEVLDNEGQPQSIEPIDVEGYLDIRDEGYGFLRIKSYLAHKDDAYIPVRMTRQYGLRSGDHLTAKVRPASRNEKNPGLLEIYTVNGGDPELAKKRPHFEDLTALFPDQRLQLEDPSDPSNMTARIIDLVSPIGKGQRGIIVSPPKAGKTTVMKTIAKSIELNSPEVELMVLLIDERPEEVTDMRRSVRGEVISSTFDRPSEEHTRVAEMTIAKARRMVEAGKDVVIMLDGITRLSRAYNLAAPASGKILSGGIDAGALYPPKKFFGSARNVEEGGSLTILATALVDTNSRMDEAIFEEFKGTGNMELRLDRKVAERRIYPAIDVDASSTRHEELLFDRKQLQQVWKLRRVLSGLAADGSSAAGLELLIDRLKTFRTNDEFLAEIAKQPSM